MIRKFDFLVPNFERDAPFLGAEIPVQRWEGEDFASFSVDEFYWFGGFGGGGGGFWVWG